jgi:hypothetical protein
MLYAQAIPFMTIEYSDGIFQSFDCAVRTGDGITKAIYPHLKMINIQSIEEISKKKKMMEEPT